MTAGPAEDDGWGGLPGEPIMWILIASELLVFGAGLAAFLGARALDPETFAAGQAQLDRVAGALNTLVLVTSGFCAAVAVRRAEAGQPGATRAWLGAAAALGFAFLLIKAVEYADKAAAGIGIETDAFFTFYYLLTGFHALHVVAGMVILGLVAIRPRPANVETGAQFWHMVDLVWVLLFPVVYLLA
jgi:nitric oxide reductase NorE protein